MDAISAVTPPQGFDNLDTFRTQRADRAYKAFESMFVQELLKEMRKSAPESDLFPKTSAMKQYEEMLDGVLAQSMADSGQLGIAKQLQAEAAKREAAEKVAAEHLAQTALSNGLKAGAVPADKPIGPGPRE